MRQLSDNFLREFLEGGRFHEIIKMVKTDPSLDVELRGESVIVYYRGGKLLTINDPYYKNNNESLLKELDHQYIYKKSRGVTNPINVPTPTIDGLELYICKAKRAIDWYEENVARKLGEKEIQQRVAYENNYSINAEDTDFFIADIEWEDKTFGGRADIIAFKWGHMDHRRKVVKMCLIEVKQGENSLKGSAGLAKHMKDFESFVSDGNIVSKVKKDMIQVLYQKYQMGLVKGLEKLFVNGRLPDVEEECDFVYLLANYKPYSENLTQVIENEIASYDNCKFFISCLMGYGLYKDFIISKEEVLRKYPVIKNKY